MIEPAKEHRPIKVAIGIPSGDMVHVDFAMCLVQLVAFSTGHGIACVLINQKSSVVEIGRCEIAHSALELGCDFLLFLDTDMVFPPDALVRLLAAGQPIVTVDASRKRPPFSSVITGMDGKPLDHTQELPLLVPVMGASTGVMLISVGALRGFGATPPFQVIWNGESFLGEDYFFSNKVREHGYSIYCHTELSREIGHLGLVPFRVKQPKKEIPNAPVTPG